MCYIIECHCMACECGYSKILAIRNGFSSPVMYIVLKCEQILQTGLTASLVYIVLWC